MKNSNLNVVALCSLAGFAASAMAQTIHPEIEPNDNKGEALVNGAFVLAPGDGVTGQSQGSASSGGGIDSRDYFLIQTTPQPLGIYRHTLTLTVDGGNLHTGVNIRGLSQSTSGIINPNSDFTLQTSSSVSGTRQSSWYGFGKQEQLFYRVAGNTNTTGNYTAVLSTVPVTVTHIGTLQEGPIEFTAGPADAPRPTALWLFDDNLNIIPDHGNHGASGEPAAWNRLTRTLASGSYRLAIAHRNLGVSEATAADDAIRNVTVTDFPNIVTSSSGVGVGESVGLRAIDQYGPLAVSATKTERHEVFWYSFDVGQIPPAQTGACCLVDGTCEISTTDRCAVWGGNYHGDGTDCATIPPCPDLTGACCFTSAPTCVIAGEADCTAAGGSFSGVGSDCTVCPTSVATAISEFTGEEAEDFSGLFTGFQQCIPAPGIFNGDAEVCATGNMLNSGGWSFACTIRSDRGTHFIGASSGFITIKFNRPVERFGGWFGSNASATNNVVAEFYDEFMSPLGSGRIDILGTCSWHWFGWEFDQPVWEIHLKNGAHNGSFLMVDYLTADWWDDDPCYADCNGDDVLNVADFLCFIDEFAVAQTLPPAQQQTHYANCTGATAEPFLTVADFLCFIDEFAQGCP